MKIRPFWLRYTVDPATESAGSTTPTPPVTPAMVTDPPPAASDQQEPPAKDAEKLGEPGKAALNAERKARRDAEKALAAMQAKVAEFEQRDMSEAEKQAAKLTQLQQENARLQADMLKAQVAALKGVPADLLSGSSQEELEAAADRLLAFKGSTPDPVPDFGAGDRGKSNAVTQVTRAELAGMTPQQIEEARIAGRLDDVLAGK